MLALGLKFEFVANDGITADGELDVVVGVRPEFIRLEQGNIDATIYANLPAGMETTVKLSVGDSLLTSVVFGGVDYAINQQVNFEIVGKGIVLFSKETQEKIAIGSLTHADAKKPVKAEKPETEAKPKKATAKKTAKSK